MESRRNVLKSILGNSPRPTTHAGLWLDKCLAAQTEADKGKADDGKGAKAELILALEGHPVPEGYGHAYARHRDGLTAEPARVLCGTAKVQGRMVIGLGAKGALEAGLQLEHTWGVPVIPGSALKGLAASTAHLLLEDDGWRKREDGKARPKVSFDELFGTTDDSGKVTFHDAWWIPGPSDATLPVHLDVMTVHHPEYYQYAGPGAPPSPSDMDSPTPIPFASVGGSYLVAVEGELAWCEAAMQILQIGLREIGVGAKTNAGYGRMALDYQSPAKLEENEKRRRAELARELDAVVARIGKNNASSLVPARLAAYTGDLRAAFASRVVKTLTRKWLMDSSRKDQPWVIELLTELKKEQQDPQ